MLRCGLAAVLFGVSTPAAAWLVADMSAFTLAGLLYLGASLAVLPFLGAGRPGRAQVRRAAPRLGVAVVLGGALGPVLLAAGLRRTPAATASLLLNLELVFTAALAALAFREHLGRRVIAGTGLVLVAGVLLGWSGDPELRWGAVLIAGACLCWAVDNGITANLDELMPSHVTFVKGLVAGSVNLAIGLGLGGVPAVWPVLGALVVGGFGYGASITLWVAGARDLGAARGQLVFATAPFIGAIVAWTAFAEPVQVREVGALLVALAGVGFVIDSGHRHLHGHARADHDHEHTHDDDHHEHSHEDPFTGRHRHRHGHEDASHDHGHLPDLHHRHRHG